MGILYASAEIEHESPVYVGTADQLLEYLRMNPDAVSENGIMTINPDSLVVQVRNFDGQSTKSFSLTRGVTYALYTKKPLRKDKQKMAMFMEVELFHEIAVLHERADDPLRHVQSN